MIKNYIFDFGNVLARFSPDELTAVYFKDKNERKIIRDIAFDRLYWDRLDDGTITDREVKNGICSRLPKEYHSKACTVYDRWVENLTPVDGMADLISDIKAKGGRLYLLSNISIGFAESYQNIIWIRELFKLFDGLVFSGPLGLVKPNKKIFEYLLKTYSLNPQECIFIDDSQKNISGGEAAGIKGCLFDGDVLKLRNTLNNYI